MTTLEYEGLTLAAGGTPILDSIDLKIEGPGLFSLLGPSGVGKSSLLRATQRLIEAGRCGWHRSGDVRLNGKSVFSRRLEKHDLARRIGFVQQRPRMLGGSVRANVEFALRHTTRLPRPEIRRRAEAAIERVGLAAELASLEVAAWKLSGGQAQRLAIARAITLDPEVLLMDEPISSLDPLSAERVEEIIRVIARDRLIVLVTHKVGLAVRLADSAGFMLRGNSGARLVEVGRAPEIFESPADPVALEFVRMGFGHVEHRPHPRGARAEAVARRRRAIEDEAVRSSPTPGPGDRPSLQERPPGSAGLGRKAEPEARGFGAFGRLYLFICGRNTSRSPIAQAICNAEIARRLGVELSSSTGAVRAVSAGLSAEAGEPMSPTAREALEELGFSPHEHATRNVTEEMVERADAIFCMTEAQRRELARRLPAAAEKADRLDPISDIGNPEGRSAEIFLLTARRIRDAVQWRLAHDRPVFSQA